MAVPACRKPAKIMAQKKLLFRSFSGRDEIEIIKGALHRTGREDNKNRHSIHQKGEENTHPAMAEAKSLSFGPVLPSSLAVSLAFIRHQWHNQWHKARIRTQSIGSL
jgi:hypothetical protein